jgi:hypothetical protein
MINVVRNEGCTHLVSNPTVSAKLCQSSGVNFVEKKIFSGDVWRPAIRRVCGSVTVVISFDWSKYLPVWRVN